MWGIKHPLTTKPHCQKQWVLGRMKIQRAPSTIPIFCLFLFSLPLSSGLKWFVSPREESGGVSLNFPNARDRLEQKLSGKVFVEESKSSSKDEKEEILEDEAAGEDEAEGQEGRREAKQFRLLSNFSNLIQSNSRLAPSSTFCKFMFIFIFL